jgi:palmitoyltransferase ZDHHC3/7/25
MTWLSNTDDDITLADAQTRMLHSVILLLESGLFGLFVIAIGVDQIHAIFYDETSIEQLQMKGSYRTNTSKYELMSEVCGSRIPIYCWLLPCSGLNNRRQSDYSLLNHDV